MDIQAERRNPAEARAELEKTKEKLSKAEKSNWGREKSGWGFNEQSQDKHRNLSGIGIIQERDMFKSIREIQEIL